MPTERLFNAVLSAFDQEDANAPKNAQQARALTNILAACASLFVGAAPAVEGIELPADDTPALILAELRKQTGLIEMLLKNEVREARAKDVATKTVAAGGGRFA